MPHMGEAESASTGVSTYYLMSYVEISEGAGWLGQHLLDLMEAKDYEVVSKVRYVYPDPELIPHPVGKSLVRAEVDVREFDLDL